MLKFAAAISLLFVSSAPSAHALSVCPISEYTVAFEANEARLDEMDLETIEASVNRARQCDINRFELVVAGDIETEGLLAHRRAVGVRDALLGYGLPPDVIHTVNVSSERYGVSLSPAPDSVSVVSFFNWSVPQPPASRRRRCRPDAASPMRHGVVLHARRREFRQRFA